MIQISHLIVTGTRINYNNHKQYLNRCMKFVRKGFRFPRCLSVIQDEVCSATIVEVEDWPPTLSSSMTYRYLNRNRNYVYPVNFVFQYRYLECPNSTTYDPQAMMTNPGKQDVKVVFVFCSIFIFLSRESDQYAVRARLGVASHLSTTPRWGNPTKCLSQLNTTSKPAG